MYAFCNRESWNPALVFLVLMTTSPCQTGITVAPSIAIDMTEAYILTCHLDVETPDC